MNAGNLGPHRTSARPYEELYPVYEGGTECPPILDLVKLQEHVLLCRFCTRQMEIAARRHSGRRDPARRALKLVGTHALTAAASVAVALLCWSLLRARLSGEPAPPAFAAAPVVDWSLTTVPPPGKAGAAQPVVSRDRFQLQVRVATARTHGWLYQIDSRHAWMLRKLTKQPDGTLSGTYSDRFDDNLGFEYFLLILADADVPALNAGDGPAAWLEDRERERLQELGKKGENEAKAVEVVVQTLRRQGWTGTAEDLRIQRLQHLPQ